MADRTKVAVREALDGPSVGATHDSVTSFPRDAHHFHVEITVKQSDRAQQFILRCVIESFVDFILAQRSALRYLAGLRP